MMDQDGQGDHEERVRQSRGGTSHPLPFLSRDDERGKGKIGKKGKKAVAEKTSTS